MLLLVLLGASIGLFIGLILGMLGAGGSLLSLPTFVYILHIPAKEAIAANLGVVGITAFVGAVRHYRAGNIQGRVAITFGIFSMLGSYSGARLSALVMGTTQLAVFATVVLLSAALMFRDAKAPKGPKAEGHPVVRALLVVFVALIVGGIAGFIGTGGGFLIVTTMVMVFRLPMHQAVGTSLTVITMNAMAGFSGYLGQVEVPWVTLGVFATFTVSGILIGTHLIQYVAHERLRRAFAFLLLVMGALILYQNRAVFSGGTERVGTLDSGTEHDFSSTLSTPNSDYPEHSA